MTLLGLLNRGQHKLEIAGANVITGDIHQPAQVSEALHGMTRESSCFDTVVDWVAYTPDHVERDIELFRDIARQYIFISSASAYQKPPAHPIITESTPLHNPYWTYSQNKIACEERLQRAYREENFPIRHSDGASSCALLSPIHRCSP